MGGRFVLGFERFLLVDGDTVDAHNLNRQFFDAADVGRPKVLASEAEPHADGLFEAVGQQLSAAGFRVIDLPIFFYDRATFSWNNALVEVYGDHKRVYLPSYRCDHDPEQLNPSFEILEAQVEAIYAGQGFAVVWFRNGRFWRTLARHGGSLHCAVKVMARRGGPPT